MSAMNRLNQAQVANIDWSVANFKLETIANNISFFNKIKKSSPKQIMNFITSYGASECLEHLGVVKLAELLSIARDESRTRDIDFVAELTTDKQIPKSFVFEFKNNFDLSSMYTQEWCNVETLIEFAEEVDMVGAILHNCSTNPERNDFIKGVGGIVQREVERNYYGFCVSTELLSKYNVKLELNERDIKIRGTLVNKKTIHKAGVPELLQYEGLTIDECAYKMNTTSGSYGSLIKLVSYIRSVYDAA